MCRSGSLTEHVPRARRKGMDDLIFPHRITSYECGADLQMKTSAFLHYCQEVAEQHADQNGLGYDWGISHGMIWVEVQGDFEFLRRPRWKEEVLLRTNTGQATPLQARRFVEMRAAGSGELLARADLMWVLIDVNSRRPVPLRKAKLDINLPCPAICSPCEFQAGGEAALRATCTLVAPLRDVDFNGHINNAAYLIWALDTLPEPLRPGGSPTRVHLCFRHETLAGTPISIEHRRQGNCTLHRISSGEQIKAEAEIRWE